MIKIMRKACIMKRKCLSVLLAILLLGATILPITGASSYNTDTLQTFHTTLNFAQSFSGQTRRYIFSHIRHVATTTAPTDGATGNNFAVALVRGSTVGAPAVGFENIPRNGTFQVAFNFVGAGDYHFRYTKSNDGIRIVSNNVRLQSQPLRW